MYRLIIGNVRVTVAEDSISRDQAADAARKAIEQAAREGKLLSHIEISTDELGLVVQTSEKAGCRLARKTIKQSMLDAIDAAVQEKLFPSGTFANKDLWFDSDTGQEWRGNEVTTAREEVLQKFKTWLKTQTHDH